MKNILSFLLFIAINIMGCYSFREISRDDYLAKDKHNNSKVVLNNKDELIIEEDESTKILYDTENIIIINDTSKTNIPFTDINKIMEEKFDFGKTFVFTFWLTFISLIFISQFFKPD